MQNYFVFLSEARLSKIRQHYPKVGENYEYYKKVQNIWSSFFILPNHMVHPVNKNVGLKYIYSVYVYIYIYIYIYMCVCGGGK